MLENCSNVKRISAAPSKRTPAAKGPPRSHQPRRYGQGSAAARVTTVAAAVTAREKPPTVVKAATPPSPPVAEDDAGAIASTASPLAFPLASPALATTGPVAAGEPPLFEGRVMKHGVPWRGSYPRTLVVRRGVVTTADPANGRITNTYTAPRDVFCVTLVPGAHAASGADALALCLHVAPWPGAPAFTGLPLMLDAGGQTQAVLDALAAISVRIQRC